MQAAENFRSGSVRIFTVSGTNILYHLCLPKLVTTWQSMSH
jgi:hypothetical protein